jgi:HSP20 family protein
MFPDMDEFFSPLSADMAFSPAMDVYEDKDSVVVETPLAGIDPDKVNIEIEDNILKVSGKSEHSSEVDDKRFYRREWRTGSFYRAVALPKAVDGSKAEASYDKGVLKITIPRREEAKPKAIKVKAVQSR